MTQPSPAPIGIMAAMPQELAAVLQAMTQVQTVHRAGRVFHVGQLHGQAVVAVLSRIGKVAAATTSTLLLSEWGANRLVFIGVAGGLGAGVRVGDVVLAQTLVQHDMDASPLFPRFELPGLGLSHLPVPALTQASWLGEVVCAVAASLDEVSGDANHPVHQGLSALGLGRPRVHHGLLLSGDQFVGSAQACAALRAALPEALAVEMEGAAVAQVCHDFEVPCVVIRSISDRADEAAHVDFPRFLEAVASPYAKVLLAAVLPLLAKL